MTGLDSPRPGKGGGKGGDPPVDRVRVVADPAINALLLRASSLDSLTIRDLIAQLDVPEARDPFEQPPEGKKGFKKGSPKGGQ